jgi:hypothetical protein
MDFPDAWLRVTSVILAYGVITVGTLAFALGIIYATFELARQIATRLRLWSDFFTWARRRYERQRRHMVSVPVDDEDEDHVA